LAFFFSNFSAASSCSTFHRFDFSAMSATVKSS